MKKQNIVSILMMAFLIFGCTSPMTSTPLPSVSPVPVESQTLLSPPMLTELPTAIQPLATPPIANSSEPPLKTKGPYLTYFREVNGRYQLVMMDVDGGGRKTIDLPEEVIDSMSNVYTQLDVRYVSPDRNWLAFYAGSAGDYRELMTPGTFDLTLNLLNLNTGETQVITPLLSKDYPDNFVKAIDEIDDSLARPEDLQNVFLTGITQALAWSPDGKYLAFAGQMDGLSSDPYLYDMVTKKIQRLPGDKEELQWINWSPDGKWILLLSKLSNDNMNEYHIYSVARDNSSVHDLGYGFSGSWLNSREILEYRMGIEKYQLNSVDVATGKFKEIWKGYFSGYSVDPTGSWVALTGISSAVPPEAEEPGFIPEATQLISLKSFEKIQIQEPSFDPSSDLYNLFVYSGDGKVIDLPNWTISASPDMKYWAFSWGQQYIKIYTYDLTSVKEISIPFSDVELGELMNRHWPDDMQWSPDSSGLFLAQNAKIYYINISNGDVNVVETHLISAVKWMNGQ